MTSVLNRSPAVEDSPVRSAAIVFVADRCVFGHDAVLVLLSWWARGRGNTEFVLSRIRDARHDLARGVDRTAVIRSLMHLFRGAERDHLVDATRAYLRHGRPWSSAAQAVDAAARLGGQVVLVSELALFSLTAEIAGVDALLCSAPVFEHGRLTGEIDLVREGTERLAALASFAGTRGVRASDCALIHCGDPEDVAMLDVVGSAVDVRVLRS